MNCIVCTNDKLEDFYINQRLRGEVKWLKCTTCKAYFTPKAGDDKEVDYLTQNPWGKKEEGIKLSDDKKIMFSNIYKLLESVYTINKDKILDIGSSFGGFAQFAKEKNNEVYAYDIFSEPVEYLNSLGIKAIISNSVVQYFKKSAENEFDIIAAIDCICYWENIDTEFKKVNEILKSGGYFVMRNPDKSWLLNLGKLFNLNKIKSKCVHDHTNVVPIKTIIKKLKETGFDIVKISFKEALPNKKIKLITRIMYNLGGILYKLTGFHFSPGYVLVAIKIN